MTRNRLVVAIDCDDVLVPSTGRIVNAYNMTYHTNVQVKDAHTSGNLDWQADRATVLDRIVRIQLSEEYRAVGPYPDAVRVVRKLAGAHELHLLTARSPAVASVTQAMIDAHFSGVFTSIEHVGPDGTKGDICARLGAGLLIDDNKKHLDDALAKGVRQAVLFGDYPWQQKEVSEPVSRCKDWAAVEAYSDGV
jgi:5'(3')-deoxyribonucleotidase